MYTCIGLNKTNLDKAINLNRSRYSFNKLNENLIEYYEGLSFFRKFFLVNRIKLLKKNNNFIGYIWTEKNEANVMTINSMYVNSEENQVDSYKFMLSTLRNTRYIYNCEKQGNNYDTLNEIGFKKLKGNYSMHIHFNGDMIHERDTSIEFEVLKKGIQEELRCKIQNEVFQDDSRIPLNIEDMYYDELQGYYCDYGAVFIKTNNVYIGYGQVILHDNIPTIVNIGILKEFRGYGYGKQLVHYLLKLLANNGFKEANLKVAIDNYVALSLYKSLGFEITGESCIFEYKK